MDGIEWKIWKQLKICKIAERETFLGKSVKNSFSRSYIFSTNQTD